MTATRTCIARVAAAAAALTAALCAPAFGQEGEQEIAPAAEAPAANNIVETYQDWRLRCIDPGARTGCDIVQTISHRESGVVLMSLSIAYAPDQDVYVTQILVPLGVDLRRGVDISVGEVTAAGVPVTRCEPAGCVIEAAVANDMVAAMQSASTGLLTVYSDAENGASVEFSLAGFTGALAALKDAS